MRVTDLILRIRETINDPLKKVWSDAELLFHISDWQASLFRQLVETDESFYMKRLDLLGTDAVKIHLNRFSYQLPNWVYRVHENRKDEAVTENRGAARIPGRRYNEGGEHWEITTRNTFEMEGKTIAEDLELRVGKTPARLHFGTTPKDGAASTLWLDPSPTGELEDGTDWYANAIFEITGVATPVVGRDPVGQVRKGVSSQRVWDVDKYLIEVTVDRPWDEIPDVTDTYEMHVETDEPFITYLRYLVAMNAFEKTNNAPGQGSIRALFNNERQEFKNSLRTRQDMVTETINKEPYFDDFQPFDEDRDPSNI